MISEHQGPYQEQSGVGVPDGRGLRSEGKYERRHSKL